MAYNIFRIAHLSPLFTVITFHHSKKKPPDWGQSLPLPTPSSPGQVVYFLSIDLLVLDILYKQNNTICGLPWLLPLSIMFLRFTHVAAGISNSVFNFWLNNIPLCGHTTLYPRASWWPLGWFHLLATVNNTFINISGQGFVRTYVVISLGHIPRSGIWVLRWLCLTCEELHPGFSFTSPNSKAKEAMILGINAWDFHIQVPLLSKML